MDDPGTQINPMGSACDEVSFPADAVMPAQFYPARHRSSSVEPILHLMAAILIDAVRCFQSHSEARDTKRRREFSEADLWIFHDKGDGPFSFENVCAALEIDPSRLRKLIVEWNRSKACTGSAADIAAAENPHYVGPSSGGELCGAYSPGQRRGLLFARFLGTAGLGRSRSRLDHPR